MGGLSDLACQITVTVLCSRYNGRRFRSLLAYGWRGLARSLEDALSQFFNKSVMAGLNPRHQCFSRFRDGCSLTMSPALFAGMAHSMPANRMTQHYPRIKNNSLPP